MAEEFFSEEAPAGLALPEGVVKEVNVNAFERSARARAQCIQHFGHSCTVCGMEFGDVYGEFARGFIHVHHLIPLSDIREEHMTDPVRDLRPVCPNCHAMLHYGERQLSIEELREIVQRRQCS